MIVRQLYAGEAAVFADLRLKSLEQSPESFAAELSDHSETTPEGWEALMATRLTFVAYQDERPVGLASLTPQTMSRLAHRGEITNVFVLPDAEGKGVGRALIEAVAEEARRRGLIQIELTVNSENDGALRFYEALGFRRVGIVPNGFCHAGRYIDEVIMVRALEAKSGER